MKIKSVITHDKLPSDHCGISIVRSMNIKKAEETYINVRNLNNCKDMNEKVIQHEKYFNALSTSKVNEGCENIINIVKEVFNKTAPIKKIKLVNKLKVANNNIIKEAISVWDKAYKEYKNNKTNENKLKLKNIKYKTAKLIKN